MADKIENFFQFFFVLIYWMSQNYKSKNHSSTILQIIKIDKKGRIKITHRYYNNRTKIIWREIITLFFCSLNDENLVIKFNNKDNKKMKNT